jgi:hypothetical protein
MAFAAVDGSDSPEVSSGFQEAIGALYSVSYGLIALKAEGLAF